MRCCADLIKFILFLANFVCFLCFAFLLGGTIYILVDGENTFIGQHIEPSLSQTDPSNATYFSFIIISIVLFSFLALFTCLGCCGAAYKSGCMLGSFIVILFVLFGGSVGAVVFLHTQYGWEAVKQVLEQEMTRSVAKYREENKLTKQFWDWIQPSFQCCGVAEDQGWKVWEKVELVLKKSENWKVPQACCRLGDEIDDDGQQMRFACMYEPSPETAFLTTGCAPRVLLYVQMILYGAPILMLISLVFAFVTSTSVTSSERRRKAQQQRARDSQYSIGADDDFQHHSYPTSYPSAPTDNEPYNPGYYDRQESSVALPRTGYHGGVGVYSAGPIAGSAPPAAHMPLLHQAPPSYNEVVYRK